MEEIKKTAEKALEDLCTNVYVTCRFEIIYQLMMDLTQLDESSLLPEEFEGAVYLMRKCMDEIKMNQLLDC